MALDLEDYHPSVLLRCWLGHLTCKIVSEMTYNVSSGTLNPTIYYTVVLPRSKYLTDYDMIMHWHSHQLMHCSWVSSLLMLIKRTSPFPLPPLTFPCPFSPSLLLWPTRSFRNVVSNTSRKTMNSGSLFLSPLKFLSRNAALVVVYIIR